MFPSQGCLPDGVRPRVTAVGSNARLDAHLPVELAVLHSMTNIYPDDEYFTLMFPAFGLLQGMGNAGLLTRLHGRLGEAFALAPPRI